MLEHKTIAGRRVLVTGAAGSIGSALCSRLLDFRPASLVCLDISEINLFSLRQCLQTHPQAKACSFQVADINNDESIPHLFLEHQPQSIFHVAAHKHVPLMETKICQAVKNNVFGLLTVLNSAWKYGASSLTLVSSDKAVNPVSVVGVTKRIGELILATQPMGRTRCISVRFGNILGSSGSVVPIWVEQLRRGEPLTVTHPQAERYLMHINDAVELLLQSTSVGQHGDVLVFEPGEPILILDLALRFIRLSCRSSEKIRIEFVGLRRGEKLKEQ
jgi:FlaA1/EpsC-like NDP-sugar epimerase